MEPKNPPKMFTHNHTPYSLATIEGFPFLGKTTSTWRNRHIKLYAHPDDAALLISVGTTFDQRMRVIATEPRSAWATALAYATRGQIYVSS